MRAVSRSALGPALAGVLLICSVAPATAQGDTHPAPVGPAWKIEGQAGLSGRWRRVGIKEPRSEQTFEEAEGFVIGLHGRQQASLLWSRVERSGTVLAFANLALPAAICVFYGQTDRIPDPELPGETAPGEVKASGTYLCTNMDSPARWHGTIK